MEGEDGADNEDIGLEARERSKSEGHELMDTMEAGAEAVSMEWSIKGQEEEGAGGVGDEGVESGDKAPPIQLPPGLISAIVECLEELKKCLEKAAHTIVRIFFTCSQKLPKFPGSCVSPVLVESVKILGRSSCTTLGEIVPLIYTWHRS